MPRVLQARSVSKQYRLGAVGARSASQDLKRMWRRVSRRGGSRDAGVNDLSVAGSTEFVWALRDVSFDLDQGDALGVIGRNGAGKSTLLKILSRVTAPTEGEVRIRGRVTSLLEVGTGFHAELTGRENVYLSGSIHGLKRDEVRRKLDDIVEFAGVERYIDTPVKRYSSGMFVRLGFSVAAHLEPDILIVDEVLAVGDADFQRQCIERLGRALHEGRTVLFVSHNMALVERLCDRVLFLERGSIAADGASTEIIDRYLRPTSSSVTGFADVRSAPRLLDAEPAITGVGLRIDERDGYSQSVATGDDLIVEVQYDLGERTVDGAVIGISSLLDQRVMTVVVEPDSGSGGLAGGNGVLECRIDSLPLAHGEYSIGVELRDRMSLDPVDYVHNALHFTVRSPELVLPTSSTEGGGFIQRMGRWRIAGASDG